MGLWPQVKRNCSYSHIMDGGESCIDFVSAWELSEFGDHAHELGSFEESGEKWRLDNCER